MKKIGFVDYYISEWHANNYPAWFMQANEKLGLDYQVAYAWAELDVSPVTGETTDEWCERMGAVRCRTLQELCEKSDVIVILAPSHPQKHLAYAREVLPFGKRTYIDKTFAPDLETAQAIYQIAREYNTAFFSSSALRYSEELKELQGAENIMVSGGGSNLEEYVIHLVEMAVCLLKDPAVKVQAQKENDKYLCRIETKQGKKAAILYDAPSGYAVDAQIGGKGIHKEITSAFFNNLIEDMLLFFETGNVSFDTQETLEVMRVRDGILKSAECSGAWVVL